jgi:hypothetical protein
MNSASAALVLFLTTVTSVSAAPDAAPVPRLGTAPASSTWTITYQYRNPNPYLKPPTPAEAPLYKKLNDQSPRFLNIEVIKAETKKKEVYHFDNQTEVVRWIVDKVLFWGNSKTNTFLIHDEKDPMSTKFSHDFDSLAWVDQADYEGHQTFQQIDCCAYHSKATPQGEQTAYIDAKSGLPVGVQQTNLMLTYTFRSPGDPVDIPPAVEAQLKAYLESTKRP